MSTAYTTEQRTKSCQSLYITEDLGITLHFSKINQLCDWIEYSTHWQLTVVYTISLIFFIVSWRGLFPDSIAIMLASTDWISTLPNSNELDQ